MSTLAAGAAAPDFALPDLTGQRHALSDALRRGPVVLVFWKTDCRTSETIFPYLELLRQAYPGDGWQLWAIGQDPAEAIRTFLGQVGTVTFTVLNDYQSYAVSKRYDPVATPTLFVVEPAGTIALVSAGFRKDDLNAASARLAEHFAVTPVVVAPADDGNPPFRPG